MIKEKQIGDYFVRDQLEIEKVLKDYKNYIVAIIRNFGAISIEDEEEIISDVLFVLWKNTNKLNKNLKFSPYIAGITRRIILKKYKHNFNEFAIEDYDKDLVSQSNIDEIIETNDIDNWIIENIKKLGDREYQIFVKFYFEDKKIKNIASEMGLSTSNVKTILHRTRKHIGKNLLQTIFVITICVISITGIVFAKDISKKIYENFWQTGNGIGHAMEEGYIEKTQMENTTSVSVMENEETGETIEDLETAVKVDEFIMDDFNLSITFNVTLSDKFLEIAKAEEIWEMNFTDIVIKDEQDYILYYGAEKYKEVNTEDAKIINTGVNTFLQERKGNTLKVIYNIYTGSAHFPKSKKLNVSFTKINISKDDSVTTMFGDGEYTFIGDWNFTVDVPEKMYNRQTIIYNQKMSNNKEVKVTEAVIYDTGMNISVEVKVDEKKLVEPIIPEMEFFRTLPEESEYKTVDSGISTYLFNKMSSTKEYQEYLEERFKAQKIEVYLLNENGEKFGQTEGPRENGSSYIENGVLKYNAMFDLTKYDMTDEIKAIVVKDEKETIVTLEREVEN